MSRYTHFASILPERCARRDAKSKFVEALRFACPHHPALSDLDTASSGLYVPKSSLSREANPNTRIIVPFHPVCVMGNLSGVASNVFSRHISRLSCIGSLDFSVVVSWSLASPHLVSRMQALASGKIDPGNSNGRYDGAEVAHGDDA